MVILDYFKLKHFIHSTKLLTMFNTTIFIYCIIELKAFIGPNRWQWKTMEYAFIVLRTHHSACIVSLLHV